MVASLGILIFLLVKFSSQQAQYCDGRNLPGCKTALTGSEFRQSKIREPRSSFSPALPVRSIKYNVKSLWKTLAFQTNNKINQGISDVENILQLIEERRDIEFTESSTNSVETRQPDDTNERVQIDLANVCSLGESTKRELINFLDNLNLDNVQDQDHQVEDLNNLVNNFNTEIERVNARSLEFDTKLIQSYFGYWRLYSKAHFINDYIRQINAQLGQYLRIGKAFEQIGPNPIRLNVLGLKSANTLFPVGFIQILFIKLRYGKNDRTNTPADIAHFIDVIKEQVVLANEQIADIDSTEVTIDDLNYANLITQISLNAIIDFNNRIFDALKSISLGINIQGLGPIKHSVRLKSAFSNSGVKSILRSLHDILLIQGSMIGTLEAVKFGTEPSETVVTELNAAIGNYNNIVEQVRNQETHFYNIGRDDVLFVASIVQQRVSFQTDIVNIMAEELNGIIGRLKVDRIEAKPVSTYEPTI